MYKVKTREQSGSETNPRRISFSGEDGQWHAPSDTSCIFTLYRHYSHPTMRVAITAAQAAASSSRTVVRTLAASPTRRPIPLAQCSIHLSRRSRAYVPRSPLPSASLPPYRRYATSSASPTPPPPPAAPDIPPIDPADSFDIVIIGGANAGLALACALLSHDSIRTTTRILLLEGGSLDKVRAWTGDGNWENRVSSLTADNVAWLRGERASFS